jgi:hypothetical protein
LHVLVEALCPELVVSLELDSDPVTMKSSIATLAAIANAADAETWATHG